MNTDVMNKEGHQGIHEADMGTKMPHKYANVYNRIERVTCVWYCFFMPHESIYRPYQYTYINDMNGK